MVMKARSATFLALMTILCGPQQGAHAQTSSRGTPPAAVPAPVPALPGREGAVPRPDRTTASYGDWVLRCELSNGSERGCEVAQTIQDGRGQVLALVTARRATPTAPITFTAQVGINTTVAEPARLVIEDQAVLSLVFRRCMPRGCFAEAQLPEGEASSLVRRNDAAKLEYRASDESLISIPVSLRGLTPSLEALSRHRQFE
jgi:invasion protein IalB